MLFISHDVPTVDRLTSEDIYKLRNKMKVINLIIKLSVVHFQTVKFEISIQLSLMQIKVANKTHTHTKVTIKGAICKIYSEFEGISTITGGSAAVTVLSAVIIPGCVISYSDC